MFLLLLLLVIKNSYIYKLRLLILKCKKMDYNVKNLTRSAYSTGRGLALAGALAATALTAGCAYRGVPEMYRTTPGVLECVSMPVREFVSINKEALAERIAEVKKIDIEQARVEMNKLTLDDIVDAERFVQGGRVGCNTAVAVAAIVGGMALAEVGPFASSSTSGEIVVTP